MHSMWRLCVGREQSLWCCRTHVYCDTHSSSGTSTLCVMLQDACLRRRIQQPRAELAPETAPGVRLPGVALPPFHTGLPKLLSGSDEAC